VRRGRGQEGGAAAAWAPGAEWGWMGLGAGPREGWALAMGVAGIGFVMVDFVEWNG
jgi:hypothetical protein